MAPESKTVFKKPMCPEKACSKQKNSALEMPETIFLHENVISVHDF